MSDQAQNSTRTLTATVTGKKMAKTATVSIERLVQHPMYKKYQRRTTKLQVHDEHDQCKVGDTITITQCRPISKLKAWKLVAVLS